VHEPNPLSREALFYPHFLSERRWGTHAGVKSCTVLILKTTRKPSRCMNWCDAHDELVWHPAWGLFNIKSVNIDGKQLISGVNLINLYREDKFVSRELLFASDASASLSTRTLVWAVPRLVQFDLVGELVEPH